MKAEESEAGKRAFEYHCAGFHCAEAVSRAIVEIHGGSAAQGIPRVATAFGGGVGRTKQEICGALAGGFIAIGLLYGRNEPADAWDAAADLAAELRSRFQQVHGTTTCGALLSAFGPQENMMRCKRLSGEVAAMLSEIIRRHRQG